MIFYVTFSYIQILLMAIYIAVKYRNNMSIFDHHNDGLITTKPSNERQCEIASLKSKKYNGEIDLSEVWCSVIYKINYAYLKILLFSHSFFWSFSFCLNALYNVCTMLNSANIFYNIIQTILDWVITCFY